MQRKMHDIQIFVSPGIKYIFEVNNGNTNSSKSTINTPERRQTDFKHVSHPFFSISIVGFERLNIPLGLVMLEQS